MPPHVGDNLFTYNYVHLVNFLPRRRDLLSTTCPFVQTVLLPSPIWHQPATHLSVFSLAVY